MKPPSPSAAPLQATGGGPSAALLRAAEAWPAADRGVQIASVLATASRRPPRFVLITTMDQAGDSLPTGAVLAECLPGRAAVVMSPQLTPQLSEVEASDLGPQLLFAIDDLLREQGILLAQALTLTHSAPATKMFLAAGYRLVGDLLYLAATLDDARHLQPTPPPYPVELVSHPASDHDRWIPLIDETYLQTLDCPAVDGLRPTRDVLAGYLDIGRPRDDWWFIVRHQGRDVGCLILADHHPSLHAELVYMGLIPEVRGRGWGVYLAQEARRLAAQTPAQQLVLSVDSSNTPALRHYQSAGFRFWEQRTILIKALGGTQIS
jgi:ribosomal protein S18 acetylase RimI-like enzyme